MIEDITRRLVLRNSHHLEKDDILDLRGTKAIKIEAMLNTNEEYNTRETWSDVTEPARQRGIRCADVTTWSSLIRNAVDILKPQIDIISTLIPDDGDEFRATFEYCLNQLTVNEDFNLNSNCPRRLFKEAEEDDLIKSTVYKNNKNHMIKVFTDTTGIDWYMCAVYTGEIIIMLEALLDTINMMITEYPQNDEAKQQYTLVLSYVNREDIADDIPDTAEEPDEENRTIGVDELERDLIGFSLKLRELVLDNYKMAQKYNLEKAEDIIKGIYVKDIPKDITAISNGKDVY